LRKAIIIVLSHFQDLSIKKLDARLDIDKPVKFKRDLLDLSITLIK
jgi:hypothetical protein